MIITDTAKARSKFNNWKQQNYKYVERRFASQNGLCAICHQPMVLGKGLAENQHKHDFFRLATFDHIVRLKDNGDAIDMRNLRLICTECNQSREAVTE